jgi:aryl-alcohol dehydrogenase-like predicted oxidoreductase
MLAGHASLPGNNEFTDGESVAQVSLYYVLSNPHITCAIPGMGEMHELNENLQVGRQPRKLTREDIKALIEPYNNDLPGFKSSRAALPPYPNIPW